MCQQFYIMSSLKHAKPLRPTPLPIWVHVITPTPVALRHLQGLMQQVCSTIKEPRSLLEDQAHPMATCRGHDVVKTLELRLIILPRASWKPLVDGPCAHDLLPQPLWGEQQALAYVVNILQVGVKFQPNSTLTPCDCSACCQHMLAACCSDTLCITGSS